MVEEGPQPTLRVYLRYSTDGEPVIHGIERISRPGRRVYRAKDEIPGVLGGLGLAIVSTSQGVLSGRGCRQEGRRRRSALSGLVRRTLMSRIGKKAISLPKGVEVKQEGNVVTVKGPKGTLSTSLVPGIGVTVENNVVQFTR